MASIKSIIFVVAAVLAGCGGGGSQSAGVATPVPTNISTGACMQAGLQIVNANGIVQIDQNYLNLEYRTKYTITESGWVGMSPQSAAGTSSALNGVPQRVLTLTFTTPGYDNEVIVARADGAAFAVKSKVGNTWTLIANNATTLTAWLFSSPDNTPVGSAGFEVRRGDGALAFSSDKKYMKPVWSGKVPDHTGFNSFLGSYGVTLQSGDYAAALCGARDAAIVIAGAEYNGGRSMITRDGVTISGGSISVGDAFWQVIPTIYEGSSTDKSSGGWLTVVDVSNL